MERPIVFPHGSRSLLGEGLFYDQYDRMLWVDIFGHKIYDWSDSLHQLREWDVSHLGTQPSMITPLEDGHNDWGDDYLLVSFRQHLSIWNSKTNTTEEILSLSPELASLPDISHQRFNDGKCDQMGKLWIGTMDDYDRPNQSSLYRLNNDETNLESHTRCTLSNGLDWSLDGTRMYYIDTPERAVKIYSYDLSTSSIKEESRHGQIDLIHVPGKPDGMTVDTRGHLWVAMWDGGRVIEIDPETQQVVSTIHLEGVSNLTTCAFGGPGMSQLYISTAMKEGEPTSGHLFTVNMNAGIKGKIGNRLRYSY